MGFFHFVRIYVAGKGLDDRNSSETLGGGGGYFADLEMIVLAKHLDAQPHHQLANRKKQI